MDYKDELADLMRERFGPKKDREQPVRYTAAVYMTTAMAGLLTEDDFGAFLQAALQAERRSEIRGPYWAFTRNYVDHLARELHIKFGELDAADGRLEAWHIMLALYGILSPGLHGSFISCASDAWRNINHGTYRQPAAV
ncbi:hypothetical protein [Streptomyces anulatus]|uniref:hypothetical protein n=1 Tax=Streptomyces anulatus TaxID=1892 RepID=UPI0004CC2F5E|nr:hypothetical protein [Streptomyces anulatus]